LFFLVGFLDPHFVTLWMLYVTGYELFENDFLHWKSQQVFWLDFVILIGKMIYALPHNLSKKGP